jgi:choline dehydrogenase-like flavoprotein
MHPLVEACIEAAVEPRIPATDDHNGPTLGGAGWFQFTERNGRWCSTATAYLRPRLSGSNVAMLTDALATRILFENRRAVGARCCANDVQETVREPAHRGDAREARAV